MSAKLDTDTRVVQMRFDNSKFKKNVEATIKQLKELNKHLTMKGKAKAIEDVSKALDDIDLKDKNKELEKTDKTINKITMSLGSLIKLKVLSRAFDIVINKTSSFIKNMVGINNVMAGWAQYEDQITNVGGILNQVEKDGYGLNDVADAMERLQWYTDETSFSFTTLSNGIRQFTVAGIDLNKATEAAMGVTNLAGSAKVFDEFKVQSGMDAVAKAMQQGYMDTMKWTSLTNTAGIVTKDFTEILLEEAAAQGKLVKSSAGQYKTRKKGTLVTEDNIRSTLSDKWLTSDVLTSALNRYSSASSVIQNFMNAVSDGSEESLGVVNDLLKDTEKQFSSFDELLQEFPDDVNKNNLTARRAVDILEQLGYKFDDVGLKAFKSSQETTTFSQAIKATGDAVKTAWATIFQSIFGDYEQATALWSDVSDMLYDIFVEPMNGLKETFAEWSELENGGLQDVHEVIKNIIEIVGLFKDAVSDAFSTVFGELTADGIAGVVLKIKEFTESLKENEELFSTIKNVAEAFFIVLKAIKKITATFISIIFKIFKALMPYIEKFSKFISDSLEKIYPVLEKIIDGIAEFIDDLIKIFSGGEYKELSKSIGNFVNLFIDVLFSAMKLILPVLGFVLKALESLVKIINDVFTYILDKIEKGFVTLQKLFAWFVVGFIIVKAVLIIKEILNVIYIFSALADALWSIYYIGKGMYLKNLGIFIALLTASFFTIVYSIKMISEFSVKDLIKGIITVILIYGMLIATVIYLSKMKLGKGALKLVGLSLAIYILVSSIIKIMEVLEILNNTSGNAGTYIGKIAAIIVLFAAIFGLLILYAKFAHMPLARKANNFKTLLGLSIFFLAISVVMKTISKLSMGDIGKSILIIGSVFLFLFAFIFGLKLITKFKGMNKTQNLKINSMISSLAILFLSISVLLKVSKNISGKEIGKMAFIFLEILGFVLLLNAGLLLMNNKLLGIGKVLLGLSTSLLIMALALRIFNGVNMLSILKALLITVGLIGIIVLAVLKIKGTIIRKAVKTTYMILLLSSAMLILAVSMLLFNMVNWKGIGMSLLGMTMILLYLFVVIKIINKNGANIQSVLNVAIALASITGALLFLVLSILVLSYIDTKKMWASMGVAILLMGVLTAIFFILTKVTKSQTTIFGSIKIIGILAAIIIAIFILSVSMVLLSDIDQNQMVVSAIILSVLMLVVVGIIFLLTKMTSEKGKIASSIMAIIMFVVASALIFVLAMAIEKIAKIPTKDVWKAVGAISVILGVILILVIVLAAIASSGIGTVGIALVAVVLFGIAVAVLAIAAAIYIIAKAFDVLVDSMIKLIEEFKEITPEMVDNVKNLGLALMALGAGTIINALANCGAAVLDLCSSVLNLGKAFIDASADIVKAGGKAAAGVVTKFGDSIENGLQNIDKVVDSFGNGVSTIVNTAFNNMNNALSASGAVVTNTLNGIADTIKSSFGAISDTIEGIGAANKLTLMANAVNKFDPTKVEVFEKFVEALDALGEILEENPELTAQITPVFNMGSFNDGMSFIQNGLSGLGGVALDVTKGLAGKAASAVGKLKNSIMDSRNGDSTTIINNISQNFTDAMQYSYSSAREVANTVSDSIKNSFAKVGSAIKGWFV